MADNRQEKQAARRMHGALCGLLCGMLVAAGLLFRFGMSGHDVLGLGCFGLAALVLLFFALHRLQAHRWARVFRVALACLLMAGAVLAGITGAEILGAAQGDGADCKYVVVLGAGVNGTQPSRSLRERIDAAYAYLSAHPETVCVVSGGQGNGEAITEAACMFRELTSRGIAPERVLREEQAATTRENLAFSLECLTSYAGHRPEEIGLITSEYHLCRAEYFAREQGITAHGIPAKTTLPTVWLNYFLREIAALWVYRIFG